MKGERYRNEHKARVGVDLVSWTPQDFARDVFAMPKSHCPSSEDFRRYLVELVPA